MKISTAVSHRITKICIEKDISLNQLANICCITQSTLQTLVAGKSQSPQLLPIVRLCEGIDIRLKDFFDDDLFDNLERED